MARLLVLLLVTLQVCSLKADLLPGLSMHPWFGCYAGFPQRTYDIAINGKGDIEIFLKERGARLGSSRIRMKLIVMEKTTSGRVIKRSFKKDSYTAKQEAGISPELSSFEVMTTHDAKIGVRYRFGKKEGFQFEAEILHIGRIKGELNLVFELKTSDFYRLDNGDTKKEWKEQTRGDFLTLKRKDGKVLRLKLLASPEEDVQPFLAEEPLQSFVYASKGLNGLKLECGMQYTEGSSQIMEMDFGYAKHLTDDFLVKFSSGNSQKCFGYLKLR